jgi:hypothetical protein
LPLPGNSPFQLVPGVMQPTTLVPAGLKHAVIDLGLALAGLPVRSLSGWFLFSPDAQHRRFTGHLRFDVVVPAHNEESEIPRLSRASSRRLPGRYLFQCWWSPTP